MSFMSPNATQLQLNNQNNNLSTFVTTTPNNNVTIANFVKNLPQQLPLALNNIRSRNIPNISALSTVLTIKPTIAGLNTMNNINNAPCFSLNGATNIVPARSTCEVPTTQFIVSSIPNIHIPSNLNTFNPLNAANALAGYNINQNYQIHNNHSIILLNSEPNGCNFTNLNQSVTAMLPPSTITSNISKTTLPKPSTNNAFISTSAAAQNLDTKPRNIQKLESDKEMHSKESSSFVCRICTKSFLHECNLKIHSIIHTDKALHCGFCNKAFARASNLDQHLRVHTNYRPWNCTHCNKSFRQKHSLKDHLRTHTGERPFKCQFCPRAFKVKHNLVTHTRLHTGERPFQCSVCPKRFASKSSLNGHIRQKHPAIWKKQKGDQANIKK